MAENIKQIKITPENSRVLKIKNEFNKRWNFNENEENKTQLKNRCLAILNETFNNIFDYSKRKNTINKFCTDIEIILGISVNDNEKSRFISTKLYNNINELDLNLEKDYRNFMYFLELAINHDYLFNIEKSKLVTKIAEALKLSNINVIIYKNKEFYELYPSDIEFLSDNLIIDVLYWLNDFPNTKKSFSKAIKIERIEKNYRNIIDELRLSVEFLFKKIFSNEKSLENQIDNIGKYLSANHVSKQITNMYIKLIDYYTKYNNENVKHNDNIAEIEIDYIIYLTGSFIRFILLIEKNELKI